MQSREHLLLFLPYRQEVAAAYLDAAAAAGALVTAVSARPEAWFAAWPCVRERLEPPVEAPGAFETLAGRIIRLHAAVPLTRCVAGGEGSVERSAYLNEVLGLGGTPPTAAARCRDKHRMREALAEQGLPVPAFRVVRDFAAFQLAAREVGFPCVAKPVRASGSDGVVKLEAAADLAAAWAVSAAVHQAGGQAGEVLVEGYVTGPEYSVEIIVSGGVLHVAGITQKFTEPEPYFNEVMHLFPAPLGPDAQDTALHTAGAAVRALGITDGGAHLEFRVAPAGPVVIECAARLAGDSIPTLARLATGVDLYACVVRQALGLPFSTEPTRRRVAGIRFVQPAMEGVLRGARFRSDALKGERGLLAHGISRAVGDVLARPPRGSNNRLAWALAVGRSHEAVVRTLAAAEASLEYDLGPLPAQAREAA